MPLDAVNATLTLYVFKLILLKSFAVFPVLISKQFCKFWDVFFWDPHFTQIVFYILFYSL